ncbi:dehydrogenase [Aspergillus heteromorphus CBS 117.55]|uniref:Dehydrogenase n=1 Tax=Aspergillus heteromorphus CBS 117.55 TaxID=1448321 RepID=A0A317W9S1_9EURO|nr:dehydrogenase [Aspergillus heteromorphus CBS 117.55]PWY82067.1 dehydrogenase [Aspergillus heteromorphus CBS 117.55]
MGGLLGWAYRQRCCPPQPLPADIRLDGKTAIVTGGNVGLGLEAAKQLAAHGLSRVILGVRTPAKGEAAKEEIIRDSPGCDVQVWALDYESFESMRAFSERAATLDRLDMVILSAGLKFIEFIQSRTGHEMHVQVRPTPNPSQVNHLGTSLLSLLLLHPLQHTARATGTPSRLTIVTSEVHFWTPFKEKDASNTLSRMNEPDSFNPGITRYNTSKLLNMLWLRELSGKAGPDVVVNGVNPGLCLSAFHRSDTGFGQRMVNKVLAWTSEQGGHCLVDAAVRHPEDRGAYLSEQVVTESVFFFPLWWWV